MDNLVGYMQLVQDPLCPMMLSMFDPIQPQPLPKALIALNASLPPIILPEAAYSPLTSARQWQW